MQELVEDVVRCTLDEILLTAFPDAVHNFVPLPPLFDESSEHLGRILKIAVHYDDRVARRILEAGRNGGLMTEISGETDDTDMGSIGVMKGNQVRKRAVGASIVHVNYLRRFLH